MPIYDYRCARGHEFEIELKINEPRPDSCQYEECEAEVEQVFSAPTIHFKGSGFYNTDYGKSRSL